MNALTQLALAGTAKVATDPGTGGTPLDELVADLPQAERERALLLRAAAEATYTVAGYVAAPGFALPEPAPMERQKVCTPEIALLVGEMLAGKHEGMLPEALGLLAAANVRLPPSLLPLALDMDDDDHHMALRLVLGERGLWLSRFNPAWSWATEAGLAGGRICLTPRRSGRQAAARNVWQC